MTPDSYSRIAAAVLDEVEHYVACSSHALSETPMKHIQRPYKATIVDPKTGRLHIQWDKAAKANPTGVLRCADFVLWNGHAADPGLLHAYADITDQNLQRQ